MRNSDWLKNEQSNFYKGELAMSTALEELREP